MSTFGPVKMRHQLAVKEAAAQDLEDDFGEVVSWVGGNYFVNGVASGAVAGSLAGVNFKRRAGFTNDYKREPRSIFSHQVYGRDSLPIAAGGSRIYMVGVDKLTIPGFSKGSELLQIGVAWGRSNAAASPDPTTANLTVTLTAIYDYGTAGAVGYGYNAVSFTGLARNGGAAAALAGGPGPLPQAVQNLRVLLSVDAIFQNGSTATSLTDFHVSIYGKTLHVA